MTSIDEGLFIPVGGLEQWVTIRGSDVRNPAVLVLSGAGAAFSGAAPLFEPWQARFTVVQWDQPGAGATAARAGVDLEPLSYARVARDGLAVVEAALARLGQAKLALFGISGGTVVGLHMLKARPDLFSVYVATGQITNWARQEALSYGMILRRARAAGDAAPVAEIEGIGPPPWSDVACDAIKGRYANALTVAEQAALDPVTLAGLRSPPTDAPYVAKGLPRRDPYADGLAAFTALKPELAAFDAEALGLAFAVPMVFLQGAQDAHTPAVEVEAYAAKLRAPSVRYERVDEGGHMALFLRERMAGLLETHVRPLAVEAGA
ncbi:MAG: serine aminopeptidase domain-containing protein [Phenylobacterium sp.]